MHIEIIIIPTLFSPRLIVLQILDPKNENFLLPPLYLHQAKRCKIHEIFSFSQKISKTIHVSRKPGENRELIKSHICIHTRTITSAHRSQFYLQIIATAHNTTTALSVLAALV